MHSTVRTQLKLILLQYDMVVACCWCGGGRWEAVGREDCMNTGPTSRQPSCISSMRVTSTVREAINNNTTPSVYRGYHSAYIYHIIYIHYSVRVIHYNTNHHYVYLLLEFPEQSSSGGFISTHHNVGLFIILAVPGSPSHVECAGHQDFNGAVYENDCRVWCLWINCIRVCLSSLEEW